MFNSQIITLSSPSCLITIIFCFKLWPVLPTSASYAKYYLSLVISQYCFLIQTLREAPKWYFICALHPVCHQSICLEAPTLPSSQSSILGPAPISWSSLKRDSYTSVMSGYTVSNFGARIEFENKVTGWNNGKILLLSFPLSSPPNLKKASRTNALGSLQPHQQDWPGQ